MAVAGHDKWIIDDGPFGTLARVLETDLIRGWPSGRFMLAAKTVADAVDDRFGRRQRLLSEHGGRGPFITFDIPMGGEEAEYLYGHLRKTCSNNVSLAEHQAITWAAFRAPEAVLVTQDRHATVLALSELGMGRVAYPFDFWAYLMDQQLIGPDEFRELCIATRKQDGGLPGLPERLGLDELAP